MPTQSIDPKLIRTKQRVKAGVASISGRSIADTDRVAAIGNKMLDYRANGTASIIRTVRTRRGKVRSMDKIARVRGTNKPLATKAF